MGDYSTICAVSGLPITGSQQVVGFEVEPYRYEATRHRYVPKSWPVHGEYDMGGGIEGLELTPNVALIHKEVWDNAPMFWHWENAKRGPNFLDVPHVLKEAQERFNLDQKLIELHPDYAQTSRDGYVYTMEDHVFDALRDQLNKTDEALTLRDMLTSKNNNVTNVPKSLCFLERSTFGQLIVQKMIQGWTEQDMDTLYHLVCLYSGEMITGRQISPSNQPYVEQYPNYKQRIKVLTFLKKLAVNLQKKEDERHSDDED
jgi:hypothetical protein